MNGKLMSIAELVLEWPALGNRDAAEHTFTAAGFTIVEDELGRRGLAVVDVKRWRESERVAEAAAERRQQDFAQWKRDTASWEKGREQAAQAAYRRAAKAAGGSTGAGVGAGHAAGRAAAEDYERSVPRPLFDGRAGAALNFVDEDEAGTLGGRVKARARRLAGLEESVR